MTEPAERTIVCADAVKWCQSHPHWGPVVTSPPDAHEVGMTMVDWQFWFEQAVGSCLHVTGQQFPAVFYVTDRRFDGMLFSKADVVLAAVGAFRYRVLWHKIALRRDPGKVDLHRPTYSHMIAVGPRGIRPGKVTPDVFDRGPVLYPNGMGQTAARIAVEYVARYADGGHKAYPVVNPYCGRGTVLAAASAMGLAAVGIDNDPEQCEYARNV